MNQSIRFYFHRNEVDTALTHIDRQWQILKRYRPHDEGTLIGLSKPYLVPSVQQNGAFTYDELYYWDSYFTAQGLIGTSHEKLAFHMLDNLCELFERFGQIPNGNRFYLTGRSQPPLLTSYIFDLYKLNNDTQWLEKKIRIAQREYDKVWMGTEHPHWRQVFEGLSRYYDVNVIHDLAECESGWDYTTRFHDRCLEYTPIDLNALLYKYESDFKRAAKILGYKEEANTWAQRAERRKQVIDKYLWDDKSGFYFDYNYQANQKSDVWSLAGFFPLWAGMASEKQAQALVNNLSKFEMSGGLSTTTTPDSKLAPYAERPSQWAYPNGWAPLQYMVIKGLEHYGYHTIAQRIARKWLNTSLRSFSKHGRFFEKYNVVKPNDKPIEGVYPSQAGFGWTNGVFVKLSQDYLHLHELPLESMEKKGFLAFLRKLNERASVNIPAAVKSFHLY